MRVRVRVRVSGVGGGGNGWTGCRVAHLLLLPVGTWRHRTGQVVAEASGTLRRQEGREAHVGERVRVRVRGCGA